MHTPYRPHSGYDSIVVVVIDDDGVIHTEREFRVLHAGTTVTEAYALAAELVAGLVMRSAYPATIHLSFFTA